MKYIKIPFIAISVIFLSNMVYPQNISDNKITVNAWHILHNQDPLLETIKKNSTWEPLELPGFFKHTYLPINNYQYVWLKGEFDITGDPANFFGISIGRLYYTDVVYINDTIAGQTLSYDKTSVHYPRNYQIKPGILKKGKNEIYMYLGIYGKQSGGIVNQVQVLNKENFIQTKKISLLLYQDFPFALAVLFFLLFILLTIFYLFNKDEISILFSMIFFLMYAISLLLDFGFCKQISQDLRLTLLYYISALNPLNWLLITQSFFKRYLPELNKAIIFYIIIITFLIFSNTDSTSELYLAPLINRFNIVIGIFISPYLLFKVYSMNKDRMKMYLFIFYFSFIFIFYMIFFFLSLDGKYRYTVQDAFYIPFLVIHLITLIIRDIIKKETEIQNKYKAIKADL